MHELDILITYPNSKSMDGAHQSNGIIPGSLINSMLKSQKLFDKSGVHYTIRITSFSRSFYLNFRNKVEVKKYRI